MALFSTSKDDDIWTDIKSEFDASILGTEGVIYYAKKKGHLITFSLYIRATFSASTYFLGQLIKTTSLNKPPNYTPCCVFNGTDNEPFITAMIDSSGRLWLRSNTNISGNYYFISGCYYTNNP